MDKKFLNSLFPSREKPSAMLSMQEPEDRLIWSFSEKSLENSGFRMKTKII